MTDRNEKGKVKSKLSPNKGRHRGVFNLRSKIDLKFAADSNFDKIEA